MDPVYHLRPERPQLQMVALLRLGLARADDLKRALALENHWPRSLMVPRPFGLSDPLLW